MSAALALVPELARRPAHRLVLDTRLGDRRLWIRRGQCRECRCALARDERRCRRCLSSRGEPRPHLRPIPAWTDDFEALRTHAARSNWPHVPAASARRSRARDPDAQEDVRVAIVLTTADEKHALEKLTTWPIRRCFDRGEWLSIAWLELVSPPPNVETSTKIDEMIERAIWRAEKKLKAENNSASHGPY